MATEVAEAWVALKPSAKGFGSATVQQVGPEADKAGTSLGTRIGSGMKKAMLGVLGGGILAAGFLKGAVGQASDLNETVSKTRVIFGKASGEVLKFANQGAAKLGDTKQNVLDAAGTFGTFGKAAGLQGPKLAKFSTNLSQLSTDLSSFFNTDTKSAADALGAALRGEGEPMRQYGVLLDDVSLKAEAVRIGILKPTKDKNKILAAQTAVTLAQQAYNDALKEHGKDSLEALKAQAALGTKQTTLQKATEGTIDPLTQQQRVLAANSLIMRQTKDAQGDFQRTSAGLANQQRILSASVTDVKTKLGKLFLPVAIKLVSFLNAHVVPAVEKFVNQLKNGKGAGGEFAAKLTPVKTFFENVDWAGIGNSIKNLDFSGIKKAFAGVDWGKLGKAINGIDWLAIMNTFGGTAAKGISLTAVAFKFLADHANTLAKWLPVLVGGWVVYKTAQAAADIVTIAHVPTQIAMAFALNNSARANKALAKSIQSSTLASEEQQVVEKTSLLTRLRTTVATIASTIAQKTAAAASKAWAAAQWLLNAAMTANPIGLVVAAIALLVAAFIIAWKKSDTFRAVVTKAMEAVKAVASKVFGWLSGAVSAVIGFIKDHWKLLLGILGGPFIAAVVFIATHWSKIKDVVSSGITAVVNVVKGIPDKIKALGGLFLDAGKAIIGRFVDGLKGAGGLVSDIAGNVWDAVKGLINDAIDKINAALEFTISLPGPDITINAPDIPQLAKGTNYFGGGLAVVGEKGPELVRLPRGAQVIPHDKAFSGGAPSGVTIHVDRVEPHDYRAFMGDMQRRSQRAALGGYA